MEIILSPGVEDQPYFRLSVQCGVWAGFPNLICTYSAALSRPCVSVTQKGFHTLTATAMVQCCCLLFETNLNGGREFFQFSCSGLSLRQTLCTSTTEVKSQLSFHLALPLKNRGRACHGQDAALLCISTKVQNRGHEHSCFCHIMEKFCFLLKEESGFYVYPPAAASSGLLFLISIFLIQSE